MTVVQVVACFGLLGAATVMMQTTVFENFGLVAIGGATVLALILGFAGRGAVKYLVQFADRVFEVRAYRRHNQKS